MLDQETKIESSTALEPSGSHEPPTGLLHTTERPFVATGGISEARVGEERDSYPAVVAVLGERWRVIDSKCGIQWILQRRPGQAPDGWRGNAYCRMRESLLRNIWERCGDVREAGLRAVERLP